MPLNLPIHPPTHPPTHTHNFYCKNISVWLMFNPSVVAQCTIILYWLLALMYCMVVNVIKGTVNLKPLSPGQ